MVKPKTTRNKQRTSIVDYWTAKLRSGRPATKFDLEQLGHRIMSAISEFSDRQKAFNDRQAAAVDNLQKDVKFMQDTIEKLQNTPGTITPEDQRLLDELDQRADAVAQKIEALDALTPPQPPPE